MKRSPRIASLTDAIEYTLQGDANPNSLHPLNISGQGLQNPFAVVDPGKAPSFFPNKTVTRPSARASYLAQLLQNYGTGRLALVVYTTKASILREVGIVMYWEEAPDKTWKLAMMQPY
jgi:hypothetical protein